jgi:hypothetical protein
MAEQLRDGLDVPIRGVEDALPPRGDEGYRPFKACAGLALLVFAATAVAAGALASSGSLILPTHTPGAHYSGRPRSRRFPRPSADQAGRGRSARRRATRTRSSGRSWRSFTTRTKTGATTKRTT